MSIAEILELIQGRGFYKSDVEELVPAMLRAVCKDKHVDAVETFIQAFEDIDWNWYPNG